MIARFTGGIMGLLAFGVAASVGLVVGNPAEVVLSRALWALAVFCALGLAVGAAAQAVINEYANKRNQSLRQAFAEQEQTGAPESAEEIVTATAEPKGAK